MTYFLRKIKLTRRIMEIAEQRIKSYVSGSLLDLSYLGLTELPPLPDSVTELDVSENPLKNLPVTLPSSLQTLLCVSASLTQLPSLPPSLKTLICSHNFLTELPSFPPLLQKLSCEGNRLTNLPSLPPNLTYLDCNYNQIKVLPSLPSTLTILSCKGNEALDTSLLPASIVH